MASKQEYTINTISDYHKVMGLDPPHHPHLSIINFADIKENPYAEPLRMMFNFYSISLKKNDYKKQELQLENSGYNEGMMCFMAPGLYFDMDPEPDSQMRLSGWLVLIHPDFLWNFGLAKSIKQYEFFNYTLEEALYPTKKEAIILTRIVREIQNEYQSNIDQFSDDLIVTHLELLIKYADRFYHRQFLIRKEHNHKIIRRLDEVLNAYFDNTTGRNRRVPSVQHVAGLLNISTSYLNAVLKATTGQTTQQHLHNKLIERAKEKLAAGESSISEIAYELGFEHPQSFSKLFKIKTNTSPMQFRNSFN